MPVIEINTNLDESLKKITEFCKKLDEAEEKAKKIQFLTIKDMMKATGWSQVTVQELFRREDFPVCDFGKEKIVEVGAAIKYFSVPRRKCK